MLEVRRNMFFGVCVTVGIVLLASKYRDNVFRSVKQFCHSITNTNRKDDEEEIKEDRKDVKLSLDKVILADSPEQCDYAVQRIRGDLSNGILGFDCEWVNDGPVSLLQLATDNGVCALFRIGKIGYVPPKLKELLSNRHLLKVGVAPFEDGRKLTKDYGCKIYGTLDLRTLAERLDLPSPKSLAALSLEYLGLELEKVVEIRCSDWNNDTLTDDQIAYAAYDALASMFIYHQILRRAKRKRSLWQHLVQFFKNIWEKDEDEKFYGLPNGVLDARFKAQRGSAVSSTTSNNNNNKLNQILNRSIDGSTSNKNSIPARNKPLYHNCYLQAPDGDTLCTCDRKKAEWYVAKELGQVVNEDPYTVRLKFEPSGRALGEVGQYYTQVKLNQCVVCGTNEKFVRKNVVPREYRKYFPLVMKAHQSHDVLLLCPSCHEVSNYYDVELRRRLSQMCDAPLPGPSSHTRDEIPRGWQKLQSAVRALRGKAVIPAQRRKDLESYILQFTGQREFSPILLDVLHERLKTKPEPKISSKTEPHGLKVVRHFEKTEGGLVELERLWREHFLTVMKPRFLPKLWSVCHNQERLAIRQTQNRIEPQDARLAGLAH
ncbi:exonuclease 3'-5' domain-containing protein 2 [Leptopilina heterotoma]|uniref:exonuclease 3'-5' domain-containing protein 2 n=1 Tax=Leptopilina heterotoma TaxID=63436 RepID=UPI001CA80536|nr:exonuclease 3'-5' domain-containing protein 2 [Leptopilina heterotoma]